MSVPVLTGIELALVSSSGQTVNPWQMWKPINHVLLILCFFFFNVVVVVVVVVVVIVVIAFVVVVFFRVCSIIILYSEFV